MSGLLVLGRLMRADFLERVRRHSFLVTLGFTVFAAYMFLPPNHSTYATLNLSGHRGIYNSAWVGSLVSMLSVTFLALAGFYLVKNAVERDRSTGVGQILAATPLPTPVYLLAKLASNFAVLSSMVAVLVVTAAVMQLVRGEDTHIDLLALVSPFLTVTLPVMALVAALAVGFEAVPGLRGGLGNVVYFIFWMTTLSLSAAHPGRGTDILGSEVVITQMQAACARAYPDYPAGGALAMGFNIKSHGVWDLQTFVWNGAVWPSAALAARALYFVLALAVPLAAALVFDRFDARAAGARKRAPKPASPRRRAGAAAAEPPPSAAAVAPAVAAPARVSLGVAHVADLTSARAPAGSRSRLGGLIAAELRIMLKGLSRWWLLVVLGLTALSLFVPLAGVKQFVAPIALVWPVLRWSPMGTREREFRTDALLFSAPRPVTRLLVAQWVAGAVLALLVSAGALVRFAITSEWGSFAALIVAVGFIPSLALAFGIWSGSGKLFEVLYLILWYMGPMNRIPALDFAGVTQPDSGAGPVVSFLLAGVLLAAFAVAGRRRQLAR